MTKSGKIPFTAPRLAVPTLLLVGFLGAGKTTLLRELLAGLVARGLKPFVLLNDVRDSAIDGAMLRELADEMAEIDGGCICCDSIFELVNCLLKISATPGRVVLIEANGTTDPLFLLEHLTAHAGLRQRFSPLLQIGVVDLRRWQGRGELDGLERSQMMSASHLVLTRRDLVDEGRLRDVRNDLAWLNPRGKETDAHTLAEEVTALSKAAEAAPDPPKLVRGGLFRAPLGEIHPTHCFVAMQMDLPEVVEGAAFYRWLRELPGSVLRVKGIVQLASVPGVYFIFQRTDEAMEKPGMFPYPGKPLMEPCAVLIGVRLDEEALRRDAAKKLNEGARRIA